MDDMKFPVITAESLEKSTMMGEGQYQEDHHYLIGIASGFLDPSGMAVLDCSSKPAHVIDARSFNARKNANVHDYLGDFMYALRPLIEKWHPVTIYIDFNEDINNSLEWIEHWIRTYNKRQDGLMSEMLLNEINNRISPIPLKTINVSSTAARSGILHQFFYRGLATDEITVLDNYALLRDLMNTTVNAEGATEKWRFHAPCLSMACAIAFEAYQRQHQDAIPIIPPEIY